LRTVRSEAASVEQYISEAPAERREALELLRRLCVEELPGFEEAMRYGMPAYLRDGVVEVGFASQKRYLSLYVTREAAVAANEDRLGGLSIGKGCIRFREPGQIDPELVRSLLEATVSDTGPVC
jgi:uncharacterized protein YdhG (YjbR/CyaY superfamily)